MKKVCLYNKNTDEYLRDIDSKFSASAIYTTKNWEEALDFSKIIFPIRYVLKVLINIQTGYNYQFKNFIVVYPFEF